LTPQLHESTGGLPRLKLPLHSSSLTGTISATLLFYFCAEMVPVREHECNGSFNLACTFVKLGNHPLSAKALIEPSVEVPATNVLSTVVIVPHSSPSVFVEDYENPDLVDVVPKNITPGPEGEENIDASTGGDLAFSKLDDKARDAVL
ncbi:hypothetical protein Tco_1421865, partial [Tanacetum coccineum]